MKEEISSVANAQSPNSGKYSYLYEAYVEYSPDAKGNTTQEAILFFSDYNIEFKRKSIEDKPNSTPDLSRLFF